MSTASHNSPTPPVRNALASASAILLMGMLAAATLELADPTMRREPVSERAAVRQLTVTLARAVRGIVGEERAHAAAAPAATVAVSPAPAAATVRPAERGASAGERLLRAELLDLPPPLPLV